MVEPGFLNYYTFMVPDCTYCWPLVLSSVYCGLDSKISEWLAYKNIEEMKPMVGRPNAESGVTKDLPTSPCNRKDIYGICRSNL